MANWYDVFSNVSNYSFTWQEFFYWFLGLSIFNQILVALGAIAIAILIVIGVYYLLKGIAYLIYYTLKGLFYLLKILFQGLYRLISGNSGKQNQPPASETSNIKAPGNITQRTIQSYEPKIYHYCTECGTKFTDKMIYQLNSEGIVFCQQCGKGYELVEKTTL